MPKLPAKKPYEAKVKPRFRIRPKEPTPTDWVILSNSSEHDGRKVRITEPGPYQGRIGRIIRADTANCGTYRRMYCTVELDTLILTEVLWSDFIQVH